jgi:hypothetical protein
LKGADTGTQRRFESELDALKGLQAEAAAELDAILHQAFKGGL